MRGSKETSFIHNLAPNAVSRVRFIRQEGRITEFVVQLECFIDGAWHLIVRYDTAHDYAHRDILHPDGTQDKTKLEFPDYNEALTFAPRDRYERWLRQ